uniref:Cobalt transporter subunit CbtA n=1 Tax=Candidatus Kentrum sp. UNK TaxID=2126344 RepID=A0A451AD41_9GAMM|nr:MAG: cobalt transporter subunit CbtA [Candidatus Kentron sp. UNK]VFK70739.1 MAG: cobalt transporter subunit CbtA [Candidatus Kentron sp. UNK]
MFASFKKILTVAAITSLLAGVLLSLIQQFQVIPLILEAEKYERAAGAGVGKDHFAPEQGQARDSMQAREHADEQASWQPGQGLERNLFTALANIVVALGYALLLGAVVALRDAKLDWRFGLLWGLAGYVVFFVAPVLGMPPELPGSHSGALEHRQLWWLITILCTGAGLAFVFFNDQYITKIFGAVLIITPHVVGAPHAPAPAIVPDELLRTFIIATITTNAVFWLALGGFYGFFHKKFTN